MSAFRRFEPSRRSTWLTLIAALVAAGWYLATPEPGDARRTGCNQVCLGFNGPCVYTPEDFFCHEANPPWHGCESPAYTCRVE